MLLHDGMLFDYKYYISLPLWCLHEHNFHVVYLISYQRYDNFDFICTMSKFIKSRHHLRFILDGHGYLCMRTCAVLLPSHIAAQYSCRVQMFATYLLAKTHEFWLAIDDEESTYEVEVVPFLSRENKYYQS